MCWNAATEPFSKLLATGLTGLLGVQAFIIIAGVTRVLPLTGVTLPFVSYGGSSMITAFISIGLILSVDRNARGGDYVPEKQELPPTIGDGSSLSLQRSLEDDE